MATKNDNAWEALFERYNILELIARYGFYEIESRVINTVRESRLMAKFDHYINLPRIFKENKLSILPISRTKYVVGKFDSYMSVDYAKNIKNTAVSLPYNIESIDFGNLYSESSALHCAFASGIINEVAGERVQYTVSGRMSSANFSFNIRNVSDGSLYPVHVENSQLEIDAGFEGENSFVIIEAKNFSVEDFLVRQLYYPYRLWKGKLHKPVIPVLMTCSNDVFSFFIYEFGNACEYNSLYLKEQKNFIIAPERIGLNDIIEVFKQTEAVPEPPVPFPQADRFERVIDLLGLLVENDLTKDSITRNYQFDTRQTDYYTNSTIYLGLAYKYKSPETGEITYSLTKHGRSVMSKRHKAKNMLLVKSIFRHGAFKESFRKYLELGHLPSKSTVSLIMKGCDIYNISKDGTTIPRRAQTVTAWLSWILSLAD
ncbi:hypothetical protein DFR58_1375 [Anaerobacterium chartisolvens]|uniref:Translation elongation factor n=1 Tax=Anaerobacterium chartisolvens TaxID=1297424 RepID=A0A369AJF1_9FIRM|nr:translation elongation factor [Anaerobacterium chartisolvens]RCX09291.1 hypothetical protein DFR58_1375 [Anaerobacterium chartisolvens]